MLSSWCQCNRLSLNINKCQTISFYCCKTSIIFKRPLHCLRQNSVFCVSRWLYYCFIRWFNDMLYVLLVSIQWISKVNQVSGICLVSFSVYLFLNRLGLFKLNSNNFYFYCSSNLLYIFLIFLFFYILFFILLEYLVRWSDVRQSFVDLKQNK